MRLAILVLAVMVLATPAAAQDSQYWTNHYGTRAELLGGNVVGSIKDLSSAFYNPGAIPLTRDSKLVLTTSAFEVGRIQLSDGGGRGVDLVSVQGGTAPSMFAFRITGDRLGKNSLVVSSLGRYQFSVDASQRRIEPRDVLSASPGDEAYAAELIDISKLGEQWFGLTWARPAGKRVGWGISQFVAYRSQRGRFQTIAQAAALDASDGAALIVFDEYNYWNMRALWKLGVAFDISPVSFGFALTTPSVNLFGTGSRFFNYSTINVIPADSTTAQSNLGSGAREGLPSTYRSPLSIAAGFSFEVTKARVHVTGEWFDAQGSFVVLDAGTFEVQTTGKTLTTTLSQELKSVVNWGVGIEREISETLGFYGAFFTDRTAYVSREKSQISSSTWDIYHATLGSVFTVLGIEWTVGASYGFGSKDAEPLGELTDPANLVGISTRAKVKYDNLKMIVGISFPYAKED